MGVAVMVRVNCGAAAVGDVAVGLGALPGVREVDVTIQMTTHKRMWTPITDKRFSPPRRSTNA
jgi:hypothetical protein